GTSGVSVKPALVAGTNVALRAWTEVIETVQAPVPVQAPFQPEKVEPVAGVAVKVTAGPLVKDARQGVPQEEPPGARLTVRLPAPDCVRVKAKEVADGEVEVTVAVGGGGVVIVTVGVPVRVQPPPLQPEKVEPAVGAAVRVTAVPLANVAEQVAPHEMP